MNVCRVLNTKKILIIDDLEIFRVSLSNILSGYAIFCATNGQEGYKMACAIKPDIIITDNHMPVMTGIELLQQIQSNPATSDIPVIIMSSQYVNVGCPFLYKPFNEAEISKMVEDVLETNNTHFL